MVFVAVMSTHEVKRWTGEGNRMAASNIFFSVVNICIELSLYAVAVRFLDFRFFLL